MDYYRIVGKSKKIVYIFLLDENGKFAQHRITRGKHIDVSEDQITFHAKRQEIKGDVAFIKIEAPVEEEIEVVEEKPVEAPKKRGRKKKEPVNVEEILDIDDEEKVEEPSSDDFGLL